MKRFGLSATTAFGLLAASAVQAQDSGYAPLKTFAPFAMPSPPSAQRSASGAPGPAHWQNRVDYKIDAKLDPAAKTLAGGAGARGVTCVRLALAQPEHLKPMLAKAAGKVRNSRSVLTRLG